jgi:CO/xanthine dehydrogenase FAD-binding subunit
LAVQEYYLPKSLEQALTLLAEHGDTLLVMAGGTIAMPLINDGISMPEKVMGLRHAGLNTVQTSDGLVRLGATTTLTQLAQQDAVPLLREAAGHIGGWQIRNMGTLGGNLFAPPPAGDLAVALLALDTRLKLASSRGERLIPLSDFYTGFMATALAGDELVTEAQVPLPKGKTSYVKYGRKHANTPAIVTVAAHVTTAADGRVHEARIALNAVGPHPLRARRAEQCLMGAPLSAATIAEAARIAADECDPFTDAIATDWYRRRMVSVFVKRALESIAA